MTRMARWRIDYDEQFNPVEIERASTSLVGQRPCWLKGCDALRLDAEDKLTAWVMALRILNKTKERPELAQERTWVCEGLLEP